MGLILALVVFVVFISLFSNAFRPRNARGRSGRPAFGVASLFFDACWGLAKIMFKGLWSCSVWLYRRAEFYLQERGDYKARWMTSAERNSLFNNSNRGLVISGSSRLSERDSFRHVALVASTGSGKTQKFIIPNVLQLTSSAVITDPSGEIFRNTSGHLAANGFRIKVINLDDPLNSLRFNPLFRATDISRIAQVSSQLVDSSMRPGQVQDPFWTDGAKAVLHALIECLKNENLVFQNLYNLRYLLNNFGSDGGPLARFFLRNTRTNPRLVSEIRGITHQTKPVISSQVSTARVALDRMRNPNLCELTSRETLHFETLRIEKTALYVIYSPHRITEYQFLLNLLYTQLFDFVNQAQIANQPYLPIYFLLDEFGNLGTIPNFSNFITTIRKFKCSISIILQDLNQLEANYPVAEAKTIFDGGCATRIYFSGMNQDVSERLEKALGQRTIRMKDKNGFHVQRERPLLTAEELRTLPRESAILMHDNQKAVRLELMPADRDSRLSQLMSMRPAPIPRENPRPLLFVPL
jgi:type IV secretion system protein VirD4